MGDDITLNQGTGGDKSRAVQKGGVNGPKSSAVIIDRGGSGTEDLGPFPGLTEDDKLQVRPSNTLTQTINSGGLTVATTSYGALDQVGTIFTIPNAAIASGGGGKITKVLLGDVKGIIGTYTVMFFSASVTLASDNGAFTLNTAGDLDKFQGAVILGPVLDLGTPMMGLGQGVSIPYKCAATSLFAALRCEVPHTFFTNVTDLHLTVSVDRET